MDKKLFEQLMASITEAGIADLNRKAARAFPAMTPLGENWMRVAPGTDAAIWRPWSRETGEL